VKTFTAKIDIIGINPFVFLPDTVLASIFKQAKKDKGPIQVRGKIDGHSFIQTLVKYSGAWRLYINAPMLKASNKKIGDVIKLYIEFDPVERTHDMHPKLASALKKNKEAFAVFEKLPPSRKREIIRYINFLKTDASVERNVSIAIEFLLGKARFVGRDKP